MMAMVQWLDARSLFFHPHLSVSIFLALVLQVRRNRYGCHGQSVTALSPSELSNFGHSVTIHLPPLKGRGLGKYIADGLLSPHVIQR
jgi:hypothetical protein